MFEKEAEERARKLEESQTLGVYDNEEDYARDRGWNDGEVTGYEEGFKDGAEFGYNKANEWHYVKDGDLPKDTTSLYLVRVYSWSFSLSHLYEKYGMYIPTVCEWSGEHFKALDRNAYTNARNIKNCYAWKEIVLPELKESE